MVRVDTVEREKNCMEEIRGEQKPKGARTAHVNRNGVDIRLTAESGRLVCTNVHRIVHRIARSTDAEERSTARSTD